MALINYIEPTDAGTLFAGIGILLFMGVISYIIYRIYVKFIQHWDIMVNKDSKYAIIEEIMLDKFAEKKGIDLNKELIKRDVLMQEKKSIRKKIEAEIYDNLFPKKEQNQKGE